jgi:hypothetical protein
MEEVWNRNQQQNGIKNEKQLSDWSKTAHPVKQFVRLRQSNHKGEVRCIELTNTQRDRHTYIKHKRRKRRQESVCPLH